MPVRLDRCSCHEITGLAPEMRFHRDAPEPDRADSPGWAHVMKVLIVEDDPSVRLLLQTLVAEQGHTVQVAVDGAAGLDVFRQLRPDLVLSDIQMPHMDGLELLESIRAEDSDVLVVILTGSGSEEHAVRALRHGANNYLQKPIDDTDIIPLVQKYAAVIRDRTVDVEIHEMFVERAFTLQLENRPEIIPGVADRLLRETCGAIKRADQLGVRLGLVELLLNAVEHGNLGISYEEKGQSLTTMDGLKTLCSVREGGRWRRDRRRRGAWHGSVWPVRYYPAYPRPPLSPARHSPAIQRCASPLSAAARPPAWVCGAPPALVGRPGPLGLLRPHRKARRNVQYVTHLQGRQPLAEGRRHPEGIIPGHPASLQMAPLQGLTQQLQRQLRLRPVAPPLFRHPRLLC